MSLTFKDFHAIAKGIAKSSIILVTVYYYYHCY